MYLFLNIYLLVLFIILEIIKKNTYSILVNKKIEYFYYLIYFTMIFLSSKLYLFKFLGREVSGSIVLTPFGSTHNKIDFFS